MTGDATPKVRRKIALMVTGTSFFTLLLFCNFWQVYFGWSLVSIFRFLRLQAGFC
tara:strand:+ start:1265 stop:1429 length:165 start_codon:yes stop_codon:yes gene_type:complete